MVDIPHTRYKLKIFIVTSIKQKMAKQKNQSTSFKKPENKSNNNNGRYNDRYNLQLDLSGNPIIQEVELRGFYKYFLETFYLNSKMALTPTHIYNSWVKELDMHENTVKNFIKSACARGWLYEMKPIEGSRISNAYIDIKQPDYLSNGQLVLDKRFKYYQITHFGMKVFEFSG